MRGVGDTVGLALMVLAMGVTEGTAGSVVTLNGRLQAESRMTGKKNARKDFDMFYLPDSMMRF